MTSQISSTLQAVTESENVWLPSTRSGETPGYLDVEMDRLILGNAHSGSKAASGEGKAKKNAAPNVSGDGVERGK
ncbi:hypothetical protein [Deinococcus irradiatisoli]|uniref:hypothetical protein n=1 Tax=Deinococcus irradiatisoli TaxID=2202254 RepID=UPI0011B236A9|nr:hypothetical protein [Deinococcus irradiatisoli]